MVKKPVDARRAALLIMLSASAVIAGVLLLPLLGPSPVEFGRAFAGESPHREILFDVRLPRVLMAMLTGGALAVSGVLFQALLRDALADPYTLGVSSGASLGAVLAIFFGFPYLWASALLGALVTLGAVLGVATASRRMSSFTLLMTGVTVNSMTLALILFFHSISSLGQSFVITRWLMGGIEPVQARTLALVAAVVLTGAALATVHAKDWNLLSIGEDWAAARGVPVGPLSLQGYLIASALTGLVTSLAGPIGFVGLMVPHALRLSTGADHRLLLPCSFLIGAGFLAICDTAARTVLAPAEIPVGVVTAMLGGPFFLIILRRR